MIKKDFKKIKFTTGFTLVELLVTLSIFAITTGIVMSSQGKFDNSVLLTNTAYDIAITLRQAQTYGVNVKESVTGKFNSYGVSFNVGSNGDNKRFDFFEDLSGPTYPYTGRLDGNFVCTTDGTDLECIDSYKIRRGHYVKELILTDYISSTSTVDILNLSFKRPNPEAVILTNAQYNPNQINKGAEIVISSADGSATRSIVVTKSGQIYVKNN